MKLLFMRAVSITLPLGFPFLCVPHYLERTKLLVATVYPHHHHHHHHQDNESTVSHNNPLTLNGLY